MATDREQTPTSKLPTRDAFYRAYSERHPGTTREETDQLYDTLIGPGGPFLQAMQDWVTQRFPGMVKGGDGQD
jgi:hypothetical protein